MIKKSILIIIIILSAILTAQAEWNRGYTKGDTVFTENGDWYLLTSKPVKRNLQPEFEPISTTDYIIEWEDAIKIVDNQSENYDPQGLVNDGIIYLAWKKFGEGDDDIYFMMSLDGGNTWINHKRLSETSHSATRQYLIAYEPNILVAWYDSQDGVFYRNSTDNGNSWLDPEQYLWFQGSPALCLFNPDSVFLFHSDQEYYWYSTSNDFGSHWSDPQELGILRPGGTIPGSGTSENGIHITGQSTVLTYAPEVFYDGSPDGGQNWTIDLLLTEDDGYGSQWPTLGADSAGRVYITWFDHKYSGGARGDILMRRSMDDGITWEEEQIISFSHLAQASSIAANELGVFVAWDDYRFGHDDAEIYIRSSFDHGETWTEEQRVTFADKDSRSPCLLIDNNTLHLFWEDERENTVHRSELFYKRGYIIETGIPDRPPNVPLSLDIDVSPNPFNSSTTITYSGIKQDNATEPKMEIFDLMGRRIDEITITGDKSSGKIKWNADKFSSGIYFARLKSGSVSEVIKLSLIK